MANSYEEIIENLKQINSTNSKDVKLIAVSKTKPVEAIEELYYKGQKLFGENYVQELVGKFEFLKDNKDIEWHFIGHLQTNKVKYISDFINTIHSVDSLKLAEEINKRARSNNKIINVLIQVNTSGEESKFGIEPNKLIELANSITKLENLKLIGLMTIAGLNENIEQTINEFQLLKSLLLKLNTSLNLNLSELSMGMSGDWKEAIENGATFVRIGTLLFGKREYRIK